MQGANERKTVYEWRQWGKEVFSPKGGRDEEEKRKPEPIDMSFLLSAGTNVKKVALSILFFHSLFSVNLFATFNHIVGKSQKYIPSTLHFSVDMYYLPFRPLVMEY